MCGRKTTTAKRNNMRILSVVMGSESPDKRSSDTTNLLNYGFNTYQLQTILTRDEVLGRAKVIGGKKDEVELKLLEDVTEIYRVTDGTMTYNYEVQVNEIKAPIVIGDVVGRVSVKDQNGHVITEKDITVSENIEKANNKSRHFIYTGSKSGL